MAIWLLVTVVLVGGLAWLLRRAYPRPLPGVPYKESSARRLLGDLPDIVSHRRRTQETTEALFRICDELRSPIAQLFVKPFGGRPHVVVNDPREVEDILVRRSREFDRAAGTARIFAIVMPRCTLAQQTTPALRAQKRLWSDVMGAGFLRRVVAPRLRDAAADLVEFWRLKAAAGAGEPFWVYEDFECAALDAIWAAVIGTHLGLVHEEMRRIQPGHETSAPEFDSDAAKVATSGRIIRDGIGYINHVVEKLVITPFPPLARWWMQSQPTLRRHRREMEQEIREVVNMSCERFNKAIEAGHGDDDALDTCAMDLVLRREILTAKRKGLPMPVPANDRSFQDELQLLLQAVSVL